MIAAAAAAWPAWRDMSLARRTQVLFRFRELLNERKHEAAEIITSEHGKVLSDALGEVTRGLEVVEFACGIAHLLKGSLTENASTKVDVSSIRQPLGVVGGHLAVQLPGDGADVVLPDRHRRRQRGGAQAEREGPVDGELAGRAVEGGRAAGRGLQRACTATRSPSTRCWKHPRVKAISFVGSTPIARYVYETGTAHGKRVQALGGAKNHMVVLPDADLDLAADAAVNAGFGSAGERCMAISRAGRGRRRSPTSWSARSPSGSRTLRTGDGRRGCDMGPLVTGVHRDKVAVLRRRRRGGRRRRWWSTAATRWSTASRAGSGSARPCSTTSPPTCRSTPTRSSGRCCRCVRVDSYDDALDLVNSNPYGNGTAIFTNDGGAARRYQNEVEVGMVGINVPIPVPVGYYSFGGWKASLFGDTHAHGTEGVHFFTRGKVITTRWLDPSHGGLNLGFPQNE